MLPTIQLLGSGLGHVGSYSKAGISARAARVWPPWAPRDSTTRRLAAAARAKTTMAPIVRLIFMRPIVRQGGVDCCALGSRAAAGSGAWYRQRTASSSPDPIAQRRPPWFPEPGAALCAAGHSPALIAGRQATRRP